MPLVLGLGARCHAMGRVRWFRCVTLAMARVIAVVEAAVTAIGGGVPAGCLFSGWVPMFVPVRCVSNRVSSRATIVVFGRFMAVGTP